MEIEPVQNCYKTETKKATRKENMDVRTIETYYPYQNKSESVIIIIKEKTAKVSMEFT